MDEIWKPIPEFEHYSISNFGRAKSKEGKILYQYKGRLSLFGENSSCRFSAMIKVYELFPKKEIPILGIIESLKGEIWKDIPQTPDYQASNLGRIKSLDRVRKIKNRDCFYKGELLSESIGSSGYYHVKANRKVYNVHFLVCSAFHDNPNNLEEINHKDGNKLNNNEDNLEWCNRSYNIQHSWDIGLRKRKLNKTLDI